ncbi:MAG: O-antigen ligase family protein [Proteobacteria bacterium]|nr:O-antigen ligase family protein [Pseudomonadota bacterium]
MIASDITIDKKASLLFVSSFISLPLLLINEWGNSYTEPKLALLFVLQIVLLSVFLNAKKISISKPLNYWLIGFSIIVFMQCAFLSKAQNLGIAYQSIGISLCLLIVPLFIFNSSLDVISIARSIMPICLVMIFSGLSMILFRHPVFSDYSPFGSSIGLKNSFSVYLMQIFPLLLLLSGTGKTQDTLMQKITYYAAKVFLPIVIWIVLANRTRSAWMMLIFYLVTLSLLAFRHRKIYGTLCKDLVLAIFLGVVLLNFIPNSLSWRSSTPYSDSLSSLFSFEHSSGRNHLWSVALRMVNLFPWQAIGAGQYPVLWQEYIKDTPNVSPQTFAFLRPDLPLFNDYLQFATENGLLLAILFVLLVLGLPAYLCLKVLRDPTDRISLLLSLICIATCVDAFFDYPFNRPESVFVFATAWGFLLKTSETQAVTLIGRRHSLFKLYCLPLVLLISVIALQMIIGLTARKIWIKNRNAETLETAFQFWPWDAQWKDHHLESLLLSKNKEVAEKFVATRMQSWPNDPESYLIKSKYFESKNEYPQALENYKRAIVMVDKGFCYPKAYQSYLNLVSKLNSRNDIQFLSDAELSSCK